VTKEKMSHYIKLISLSKGRSTYLLTCLLVAMFLVSAWADSMNNTQQEIMSEDFVLNPDTIKKVIPASEPKKATDDKAVSPPVPVHPKEINTAVEANAVKAVDSASPAITLPELSASPAAKTEVVEKKQTVPNKIEAAQPSNHVTLSQTEEIKKNSDGKINEIEDSESHPEKTIDQNNSSKKAEANVMTFAPEWEKSIMFDHESSNLLDVAIENYEKSKSRTITKSKSKGGGINDIIALSERPNKSPSFYLNSIIYNSANSWVVWINDKKISSAVSKDAKKLLPELEVEKVSADEVQCRWQTPFLDDISPGWEYKVKADNKGELVTSEKNVAINSKTKVITFTLRPNQTFVSYSMDIEEGYVPEHILPVAAPIKHPEN
jgi:hypothetical protein